MNAVIARAVSADGIRQTWAAVKYCNISPNLPTFSAVVSQLNQTYAWPVEEAEQRLQDCIDHGLLTKQIDPTSGQELLSVPKEAPHPMPEHDWYCFTCHGEGEVVQCKNCFRVYHPACLDRTAVILKPNGFTCLSCIAFEKPSLVDRNALHTLLECLLTWVQSKAGSAFDLIPDDTCDLTEEQAQWLVVNHMDLSRIRNSLNRLAYTSISQFGVDFEILVHDVILVFGANSNQGHLIKQIWEEIKREVEASENGLAGPITSRTVEHDPMKLREKREMAEVMNGVKRRKKGNEAGLEQAGDLIKAALPSDVQINARPQFSSLNDVQTACVGGCDAKYKQLIIELQAHWVNEFKLDREKVMADLVDRLHRDFQMENEKHRNESYLQFKEEVEAMKKDLDQRYAQQLKQEIQKLNEKHKQQVSDTKKKQWCFHCGKEAIYHCCWNTAYCSVECQQAHWGHHRKTCRRKKQGTQDR